MASRFDTGVIFDFDGTLIDSESIHFPLYQDLAALMGYALAEDEYRIRFRGRTDREIIAEIQDDAGCSQPLDSLVRAKQRRFRECLVAGALPAIPGAVDFVLRLAQKGYRLAVASSAMLEEIRLGLQAHGIYHLFHGIISAESVSQGKPASEPFIGAAALLGFRAENCVAYEDSLSGMKSAADAGAMVIGVGNIPRSLAREAGAVEMIPDFKDYYLPEEQVFGYLEEDGRLAARSAIAGCSAAGVDQVNEFFTRRSPSQQN